jgi:tRNA 2-thiouridine synthesizing protein A
MSPSNIAALARRRFLPQTGGLTQASLSHVTHSVLDLKGLKCPLPALRTRKALSALAPGDTLTVICTDPMAALDIPHLLNETGDRLEESSRNEGFLHFMIRKT